MRLREYTSYWLALGILLCACLPLSAQQTPPASTTKPAQPSVTVRAGFVEDSLSVGNTVRFYVTARYDRKVNLLFPDTTFKFSPFDFKAKTYFTTKTSGNSSYDSVVYHLTTFEIDSLLYLSLPVYQLNPQDCTTFLSNQDSIRLAYVVKALPDSLNNLPLRLNIGYERVSKNFNSRFWLIILIALVAVTGIVWGVFGSKIRRHYILKRMTKAHAQFLETYNREVDTVAQSFSSMHTETALIVWKRYMEQLEGRLYTKLTTREIIQLEQDATLGQALKAVDGAIYGHDTAVVNSLENLKTYAVQRYTKKIQEVTHG